MDTYDLPVHARAWQPHLNDEVDAVPTPIHRGPAERGGSEERVLTTAERIRDAAGALLGRVVSKATVQKD